MPSGRRIFSPCALAATAALILLPAGAASADTQIREGDTFSVSAHGGDVVWSEFDSRGRSKLYGRIDGAVRRLSAPASSGLISLDLGARSRSTTRAVYQRCFTSRPCDLYGLDLGRGSARKLRSLSSRRFHEVAPSVWGRTYAFGRIDRQEPQTGTSRRGGLFVKAGRRKLRRITSRVPAETDVQGRRIAFVYWSSSGRSAVYTTTTTTRRLCRVALTGRSRFFRDVVIDGDQLYLLRVSTRSGAAQILRAPVPSRTCRGRSRPEVSTKSLPRPPGGEEGGVASLAVDDGAVFYTAGGVFAADDPPPFPAGG